MNNLSLSDDLTLAQHEIDDLWHNINSSPSDHVFYWISIASFTFAILGSISNLMSFAVLNHLSSHLSTFAYLTGLSLSDMITCISIIMTHLFDFIVQTRRRLAAGSRVLSLWISTAVTMDRWMLICYPIYGKKFCTLKRAKIIVRTLFIIACIYSIPLFFEYEIIPMSSVLQMIHIDNQSSSSSSLLIDEEFLRNSMLVTKGYSDLAKRRLYR
ncbi:unnamed protein product [Rotaria sp. Silwood2]|nr:unnamed protein product [Rotaria sp. Silwood2]CAF4493405.1 unnamed protein product [Rotaria sp. Silwood2]